MENFDFVIVATPTNYDIETNKFNTSSIEQSLENIQNSKSNPTVIIRSTVPVGYVNKMQKEFPDLEIIFVPEFLREGRALKDSLYPSRIVIGSPSEKGKEFAKLLKEASLNKDVQTIYTNSTEAESSKLFSNAYLAMRVTFFNELDSLLVETYQITSTLIDDSKLVTGEEGCLCTFDLEFVKNNTREGLFDPRKMSESAKEGIVKRLDEFASIIN